MISLSKMKDWFEDETKNSVKKIRSELGKRFDMFKSNLEELKISAAKVLLKDIEKFYQRVLKQGSRFIPNLKKNKYRNRVFTLNRALQRIQKNYQDFERFLEDKSVLLRDVDQTSDDITLIIDKVKEREILKKQIQNQKADSDKIKNEISKLLESASNLKSKSILQELDEIKKNINIIDKKLRVHLGGLDKPLRKLVARAQDGKVMVPPHLVDLATVLKEKPVKAMENLDKGHSLLNDLMEILVDAVAADKLKLKTSMNNKAKLIGSKIIEGSIKELHDELLTFVEKRTEIEKKVEEAGLKQQINEFNEKRNSIEKSKDRMRRNINDLEHRLEMINSNIAEIAAETQRNVRRLTKQDVKINIKE
ncbi:MAG: hypothetical protein ACTSSH_14410 [Candidatus Heimdallarchaeota archaeon]